MHHNIQSDSIFAAAPIFSLSSVFQLNAAKISFAFILAPSLLPQMNMVGLIPLKSVLTTDPLPTVVIKSVNVFNSVGQKLNVVFDGIKLTLPSEKSVYILTIQDATGSIINRKVIRD